MIKNYKGKLGKFSYDDAEFTIERTPELHLWYKGKEKDGSNIKIPEGIINCNGMFRGCIELETAPKIPESVTICSYMFAGCLNLKIAPDIPDSVKKCGSMFWCCTNLEILPEVPETVEYKDNMFTGCKKAIINSIFL